MPHPRFTAVSYRVHRVIFRPVDPPAGFLEEVTVQVFAEDDSEMDILHLDLNIPPGLKTSLRAVIDARLAQLETETGWTKKPL